jgi:hypothetical protein
MTYKVGIKIINKKNNKEVEMEKLKTYAKLLKQKNELEAELKSVKGKMSDIEDDILDYFAENGVDQIRVDGVTLYPRSQLWASAKTETEMKILAEHGHQDLVEEKVNTHRLSALIREMLQETENKTLEELPEWTEILSISERFKVGYRSS